MLRFLLLVGSLGAIPLSACEPEVFDPRGTDVVLYGEWDVNHEDPSMVDTCAVANLETIELVLSNLSQTESYTDETFRWPCEYGVYDSITPVLKRGTYRYQWRAYEPGATEPVMVSSSYVMDATSVSTFDLQAIDFIRNESL